MYVSFYLNHSKLQAFCQDLAVNGPRDRYHTCLTNFEGMIKIARIPKFNILEHFNLLRRKVYRPWRYTIRRYIANRQISSQEDVGRDLSKDR